ncbi:MAG: hypothetical protein ACLFSB_01575 [Chitinispirillaceae bacterium]
MIVAPSSGEAVNKAISVLSANRKPIVNKIEKRLKESKKSIKRAKLLSLLQKLNKLIDGKGTEKDVIDFISDIQLLNETIDGSHWITDTIIVRFLANLYESKNNDISSRAWNYLYYKTSFQVLTAESKYIKGVIGAPANSGDYYLYSLLKLNDDEKRNVIKGQYILKIKAGTGDTSALDSMISKYRKKINDNEKEMMAEQILGTGQARGVKAVLEDFSDPIYRIRKFASYTCTTSSYHDLVIRNLQRYHPKDTAITLSYYNFKRTQNDESEEYKKELMNYWTRLGQWIHTNYGVQIKQRPPFSNIFHSCGPKFN